MMTWEAGVMLKDRKIRRFHRSYTVDFMGLGGDGRSESGVYQQALTQQEARPVWFLEQGLHIGSLL